MPGSRWSLLAAILLAGCAAESDGGETRPAAVLTQTPEAGSRAFEGPGGVPRLLQPSTRGWEEMLERRVIRALVVYSDTNYFLDDGRARGITADALAELEKHLNARYPTGARRMNVAAIPVGGDELIPLLEEGRGDIAIGGLTITPELEQRVDFTVPTSKPYSEVVVTGPDSPAVASLDDLAGRQVHLRREASAWRSLERLNEALRDRGLDPVELVAADPRLETEDLLEMVDAGLVPITVADDYLAEFWSRILPNLVVHRELKVAEDRRTGWAIRKNAAGLKEVLDPWIEENRQGTLLGNMLFSRYLENTSWVKNAAGDEDRRRLLDMLPIFQKYGEQYGLEPLLVAAQGYQESRLDQSQISHTGAIGVMQILPTTARDPAIGIPNIEELEPNIHAGTKYLAHLIATYFDDPNLDAENRMLFAFAGYNAGPNRLARLREVAADEGLDPDRWFRNVELVVARELGREPVQYVANIYRYYVVYRMVLEREKSRRQATKPAA